MQSPINLASSRLHFDAYVVDAHIDSILDSAGGVHWETGRSRPIRRLGSRSTSGHADIPRLREGGVDLQVFALFAEPQYKPHGCLKRVLQLIDVFYSELESNKDEVAPVSNYDDIGRARRSGKLAALLSIEGGEALEGSLSNLRAFYRLGVRAMTLTWNDRNEIADGVKEAATGRGLTEFGREVVKEMNKLGMIVDVSHINERGFFDVLETSTSPTIASHSNCKALRDHPRNLTDDQIRAIADRDGVIGITFVPEFLSTGEGTLEMVIDHIDHVVKVAGVPFVGLGSDFDGFEPITRGLEDVTRLPGLTERLLSRGYREDEVRSILGENFLRVFSRTLM